MLATEDTYIFTNEIILFVPYQPNHYKTLTCYPSTAASNIVHTTASTGPH